jgi:hypothetical protein
MAGGSRSVFAFEFTVDNVVRSDSRLHCHVFIVSSLFRFTVQQCRFRRCRSLLSSDPSSLVPLSPVWTRSLWTEISSFPFYVVFF